MSIYGFIACDPCELCMWLGKYVRPSEDVRYLHIGDSDDRRTRSDRS
jgi:hypothetical protein